MYLERFSNLKMYGRRRVYMYLCTHAWECSGHGGQKWALGPLELILGGCEPPEMGAGNRTWVCCKNSTHSKLWRHPSRPIIFFFNFPKGLSHPEHPGCLSQNWRSQGTSMSQFETTLLQGCPRSAPADFQVSYQFINSLHG